MIYKKPFITAEIGNTHIGNMDRAKMLIQLAKNSGADAVKLQKRNPQECIPEALQQLPHPNPRYSYGEGVNASLGLL